MAKFKGKEVTVVTYPKEEYSMVVQLEDGSNQTVLLKELTLSKQEAMEFLKLEQNKLKGVSK